MTTQQRRRRDDQPPDPAPAPPPVSTSADFIEQFAIGDTFRESRVDRDQRLVRDVTLCGKVSKNGRTYSDRALDDAVRLYHQAPFYIDHPTESQMRDRKGVRSVFDLAGQIVNVRRVGDKVRGDLHVLEREPTMGMVFAIAEQMPHMAGNSHRARGTIRPGSAGQGDVVESLAEVFAVELVTDPATTAGLFESVTHTEDAVDFKTLTLAELTKQRPDLIAEATKAVTSADELAEAKAENKKLADKLAERETADRKRDRETLVTKKLAEAKLPAALVTEAFKTQLQEAKDEAAVDALIGERKTIAQHVKPGVGAPRSTERDLDEHKRKTGDKQTSPIDEAKVSEYAAQMGVRLSTV